VQRYDRHRTLAGSRYADTDNNAGIARNTDTCSYLIADTDPKPSADADTLTNEDAEAHADADTDSGRHADTDSKPHAEGYADSDANADRDLRRSTRHHALPRRIHAESEGRRVFDV
jgi:hypothetical protein